MKLKADIAKLVRGEIEDTPEARQTYSHDASLFEVEPQVIIHPQDSADVQAVVKYVAEHKAKQPKLSVTARSAGTDMSGGAVNDSIILNFNTHFTTIFEVSSRTAHAQPGVFYRDFEKATLQHDAL